MKIIKAKLENLGEPEISLCLNILKSGGIMVSLTDTVYGFACRADKDKAINKLMKIKRITKPKAFIILVSSFRMAKKYCYFSRSQALDWQVLRKGSRPTSIIFRSRKRLSSSLEIDGSLALRLPNNDFLIKIINRLQVPLISTSFNFSGQEAIKISQAEKVFKSKVWRPDLIINSGNNRSKRPSRLLDWRSNKKIVLRK